MGENKGSKNSQMLQKFSPVPFYDLKPSPLNAGQGRDRFFVPHMILPRPSGGALDGGRRHQQEGGPLQVHQEHCQEGISYLFRIRIM